MRKSLSRKKSPVEVHLMPKRREYMGHLEPGSVWQRLTAAGWTPGPEEPQKRE